MPIQEIPAGYALDSRGRLVPKGRIQEIDNLRDQTINKIVDAAKSISLQISEFKPAAMSDVVAFAQISVNRYEVPVGGEKGNITLTTFDGLRKVVLSRPDVLTFNEGIIAAKALLDEAAADWAKGAQGAENLGLLIDKAFAVNKAGKIDAHEVLSLRKLNIKDERWDRAMAVIVDSITISGKRAYVRVYERDSFDAEWRPIPLDIASL